MEVRLRNKPDGLFLNRLFVPERHKQILSQKKNRLREFFFALRRVNALEKEDNYGKCD
jgi:hypothetical protein